MVDLVLLSGFLGAGKTTTMLAAGRLLTAAGRRVAVITNDQAADLVDTALARTVLDDVAEIPGGCFCCRFEDLDAVVRRLVDETGVDVVIAEAVGSCTDLQATVVRPLRRFYGDQLRVAPVTAVVDPARYRELIDDESDLGYLFALQLAEADVIALNKSDLHKQPGGIQQRFPYARVLSYSAATGAGLFALMDAWSSAAGAGRDLEVDYDRYAAAEAALAWLNHTVDLTATGAPFDPADWADRLLAEISTACSEAGHLVGHAKVAVDSPAGLVKMSLTEAGSAPSEDVSVTDKVLFATATVNVRVACRPADLDALIRRATASAAGAVGALVGETRGAAFQPAYPRPTHRLPATA